MNICFWYEYINETNKRSPSNNSKIIYATKRIENKKRIKLWIMNPDFLEIR